MTTPQKIKKDLQKKRSPRPKTPRTPEQNAAVLKIISTPVIRRAVSFVASIPEKPIMQTTPSVEQEGLNFTIRLKDEAAYHSIVKDFRNLIKKYTVDEPKKPK